MGIYRRFSLRGEKFWQQNNAAAVFLGVFFVSVLETVAHRGNRPAPFFCSYQGPKAVKKFRAGSARIEPDSEKKKCWSPSCKNNYIVVSLVFSFLVITSPIIKRTSWKIAEEHELVQRSGAVMQ